MHDRSPVVVPGDINADAPVIEESSSPKGPPVSSTTITANEEKEDTHTSITATPTTIAPTSLCFPEIIVEGDLVEFPCLVGMDGEEAKATIEERYPGQFDIYVLHENSPVTMDLRYNRIRIFVDDDGIVAIAPMIA
jgi:hypothetical protein